MMPSDGVTFRVNQVFHSDPKKAKQKDVFLWVKMQIHHLLIRPWRIKLQCDYSPGWPDELVKKIAPKVAKPIFSKKEQ
jgi:hypothetical protein